MRNCVLSLLLLCSLAGCSSGTSPQENHDVNSEDLMIYSKNYSALVALYSERLSHEDKADTRKKLVQVYLDMFDPESAQFHLQPLLDTDKKDAEVWYLSAYAHYALGEQQQAREALTTSLTYDPSLAKSQNLLGIIYASENEFDHAHALFTQARHNRYDEAKVRNNLAVIDIIQQDYRAAISKLMPLYRNGLADAPVMANLLLALSKEGNFKQVQWLLKNEFSPVEIEQRYDSLRTLSLHSLSQVNQAESKNSG